MNVLEATDIVQVFGDGETATTVLRGVSASVAAGELVALVGPSGSGKSTFLSIAGTLLTPTAGALRIAGRPALGLHEHAVCALRNRDLGFVFQFHHLLEDFTAFENVVMPIHGARVRIDAAWRARARAARARRPGGSHVVPLVQAVRWAEAARRGRAGADHETCARARR